MAWKIVTEQKMMDNFIDEVFGHNYVVHSLSKC